jgi:hypothetical protein
MVLVKSTLKMSGNTRTSTAATVSPSGVGWKRFCSSFTYSRSVSVEMICAYVDGRPIPSRSSSLTRLASVKRGGGCVKCCAGVTSCSAQRSPSPSSGSGARSSSVRWSPSSRASW